MAHLLANPDLGAVFGAMTITDEDGAVRREYQPAEFSWRRYLYLGDYVPTPTIIFRRRLLETVGLLDENYVDAADYDFYLRLLRHARVDRLPNDSPVPLPPRQQDRTGRLSGPG